MILPVLPVAAAAAGSPALRGLRKAQGAKVLKRAKNARSDVSRTDPVRDAQTQIGSPKHYLLLDMPEAVPTTPPTPSHLQSLLSASLGSPRGLLQAKPHQSHLQQFLQAQQPAQPAPPKKQHGDQQPDLQQAIAGLGWAPTFPAAAVPPPQASPGPAPTAMQRRPSLPQMPQMISQKVRASFRSLLQADTSPTAAGTPKGEVILEVGLPAPSGASAGPRAGNPAKPPGRPSRIHLSRPPRRVISAGSEDSANSAGTDRSPHTDGEDPLDWRANRFSMSIGAPVAMATSLSLGIQARRSALPAPVPEERPASAAGADKEADLPMGATGSSEHHRSNSKRATRKEPPPLDEEVLRSCLGELDIELLRLIHTVSEMLKQLFREADKAESGRISRQDAKGIFMRLGQSIGEEAERLFDRDRHEVDYARFVEVSVHIATKYTQQDGVLVARPTNTEVYKGVAEETGTGAAPAMARKNTVLSMLGSIGPMLDPPPMVEHAFPQRPSMLPDLRGSAAARRSAVARRRRPASIAAAAVQGKQPTGPESLLAHGVQGSPRPPSQARPRPAAEALGRAAAAAAPAPGPQPLQGEEARRLESDLFGYMRRDVVPATNSKTVTELLGREPEAAPAAARRPRPSVFGSPAPDL